VTSPDDVVVLLDCDNTLFDNDRVQMRAELEYVDYLGALQRYRLGAASDPRVLLMSSFLVDYPCASRLYPGRARRHSTSADVGIGTRPGTIVMVDDKLRILAAIE
jgi:hypothetical protein